ncbi:hypothetical protein BC834DRAFT_458152 [Gloeopeniophorella convolvens]|nr:hypothetical protein BC834DRAFT_458152 [Gloeopeniophorella convolvens]
MVEARCGREGASVEGSKPRSRAAARTSSRIYLFTSTRASGSIHECRVPGPCHGPNCADCSSRGNSRAHPWGKRCCRSKLRGATRGATAGAASPCGACASGPPSRTHQRLRRRAGRRVRANVHNTDAALIVGQKPGAANAKRGGRARARGARDCGRAARARDGVGGSSQGCQTQCDEKAVGRRLVDKVDSGVLEHCSTNGG